MTKNQMPPSDRNTTATPAQTGRGGPVKLTLPQAIQQAAAAYRLGNWSEAEELCLLVLRVKADYFDALNLLGIIAAQTGRTERALAFLSQAAAANANDPSVHSNLGNVLGDVKRPAEALESFDRAIALKPDYAEAFYNRGIALGELDRPAEALASYERAIALKPDYADAFNNRGNALRDVRRHAESLKDFERAIALRADYAEAHNNRGNALRELRRPVEALEGFARAIALKPDFAEAHNNRGIALADLGRFDEALVSYGHAIALKSDYADAYNNRGEALRLLGRSAEARQDYQRALALKPDFPFSFGMLLVLRMQACDWTGITSEFTKLEAKIERGEAICPPFAMIAMTGSASLQRRSAEVWVKERCPPGSTLGAIGKLSKRRKIRIGYYSADFHNHATTYLIAELFEIHDRTRFEQIGFSFGRDADDQMRQRVQSAFDRFIDVRFMSDQEVARLSRDLEIDIAVDLKGFTDNFRMGIFAERAAPLQVNYLGYPGTSGADYIDYIVADRTLIPEEDRQHYSEKIVYLPNSYQVNDRRRKISDRQFTREELGLPATGFVFCCFNNSYKITPNTFDGWMRVLKQVDGSVLWLLEDNVEAAINMKEEAEGRGIDAERLVFSKRMDLPEHLARHRLADLFLDTLPCNAHTTASDSLWVGLPVLTCVGGAFAGRVAASLLNAIHLPELVTCTQDEYEALAVELALDPQRLNQIRQQLLADRTLAPLFDTALFARHIEAAYTEMHERCRAGLAPDHIFVKG